jgi:23S rRNA (cytosine1962-C5)-methyltransferase
VQGAPKAGETVEVRSSDGALLALAAYSPHSQIRARVWCWEACEVDASFFTRRIEDAASARISLGIDKTSDALRLVHAEADGLPGVIADRYGETVVVQLLSAGADCWREAIADALCGLPGVERVWERSDADARELEGLKPRSGLLRGKPLPGTPVIHEHGLAFKAEIDAGHKTGFYLDQRDNRLHFADAVRRFGCQRVLNCYAYTGGFGVAALAGGAAHVTSVDSSAPALARAEAHVVLNGFDAGRHASIDADVNRTLRDALDAGRRYDAIVLDPPKFAASAAHAERAARAYKDINRLAFELLEPGGLLFTFSCSGGIAVDLFHKIVAGAGLDAGVDGLIYARLGAAPDHPMTVTFPEGEYLKGLVILKQ